MMQVTSRVLLVLLGFSIHAQADISFNGSLLSDYIYRGNTQTQGRYALQLGADYTHTSGLYVGTMVSNIEGNRDPSYELRGYGGYAISLGHWFFDAGYQTQRYPGLDDEETVFDEDVNEVYVGLGYRFLSLEHFRSVDTDDNQKDDHYTRLGADFALTKSIDLSLGVGLSNPTVGDNVSDYLLGFDFDFSNFILELNYTATDSSDPAGNGALAFGVRKEY